MAGRPESPIQSNGVENVMSSADISPQPSQQEQRLECPSPTMLQSIFSWRAFIALHMNLSIVLSFVLKLNISMALVCMLKSPLSGNVSLVGENVTSQDVTSHFNISGIAPGEIRGQGGNRNGSHDIDVDGTDSSTDMSRGEFEWESSTQGLILTSANILGFVIPLMTDFLTRKMGAKLLMTLTMVAAAILTLLHPLGARASAYVLIAMRIVLGVFCDAAFPIVTEVFSWWAPDREKVNMMSFAFSGFSIAIILSVFTSGYLCSVNIDNGWPFIFYVQGALLLAWCVLWQFTGTDKPEDHPFISEDEKLYIIRTRVGMAMNKNQKRTSPPYRTILTSVPVWGYLGVMNSHYFASLILFTYLPLFYTNVFGISVENVGLILSVGYVVRFIGVIMWGQLSNFLLNKTRLGKTACRKLVQCGGFYMTTGGLIALGFITDKILSITVVFAVMFVQSSTMASGIVTPLDIAPRYSGFLSGMYTAMACTVSFPGPIMASLLIADAWAIPLESNEAEEPGDPLHASDLMARRMSVLSMGPPVSPTQQKRFDFTITISPTNSVAASADSRNIHPNANGSLRGNSSFNKEEELNADIEWIDQDKNTPSTSYHHIRPEKLSYTNPGFELDAKIAQHKTTEQESNKLQAEEPESGNASSDSKGKGHSKDLKQNPVLKLYVSQSVPVMFNAGEAVEEEKAENFEETRL